MKQIAHFYNKKIVKWFIIPFLLLIGAVGFSFVLYPNASIATIEQRDSGEFITHAPAGKLLKGESITGEFKATENNLGIVQIRFQKIQKKIDDSNQDIVIFSIKERGEKTLWYQNTYHTKDIVLFPFYPFGFRKITDSKDKIFIFNIKSLQGNNYNALSLSHVTPVIINKYVYSRRELFNHKSLLATKVISMFSDIDFLIYSLHFFYPLIAYLLLLIVLKFFPRKHAVILFLTILTSISVLVNLDLFLSVFFILIILWIAITIYFSLDSTILFAVAGLFLLFAFIAILFGDHDMAGRFSNWTYIFLVIGAVQLLRELKYLPIYEKK